MIKIAKLEFNPFRENTYVVSDSTGECIIVDAGSYGDKEEQMLAKYITDNNLKPVMAVNTHGHIDHILGVACLKREFDTPFALHGKDNFLVQDAPNHGKIYGFRIDEIPTVDIDLSKVTEITFGHSQIEIIHTPGHTPGHVCLYERKSGSLFTGDTLFRESIGRTDLPGGDYSWIMNSILDKIMPLGGDVKIYPGHGAESTIGHEMLYNPFVTEVIQGQVNP